MATVSPYSSGAFDPALRVPGGVARTRPVRVGSRTFVPVGISRIYVCGITPYDVTHLGHAATFVWADVLASIVASTGARVAVCRNVTDVDDVLVQAAQIRGRHFDEFALSQEFLFNRSMNALRVPSPEHEPRARHHIATVQQLAQALLDAGAAYERDGYVLFRGATTVARSGLAYDEAVALVRRFGDEPHGAVKDDPCDAIVWQPSRPTDPAWPSPWGWGRPGWHAECAAIATAVHGPAVDVVVGGDDLAFPHHAYQAAMVEEASLVSPFARATVHVGSVCLDGERMAKSTGNLVLVDDVLATCAPAALRLLLLDRRYDESWDFEAGALAVAQARLESLYEAAARPGNEDSELVVEVLRDDLDVPRAVDLALETGGGPARDLIKLLRLG